MCSVMHSESIKFLTSVYQYVRNSTLLFLFTNALIKSIHFVKSVIVSIHLFMQKIKNNLVIEAEEISKDAYNIIERNIMPNSASRKGVIIYADKDKAKNIAFGIAKEMGADFLSLNIASYKTCSDIKYSCSDITYFFNPIHFSNRKTIVYLGGFAKYSQEIKELQEISKDCYIQNYEMYRYSGFGRNQYVDTMIVKPNEASLGASIRFQVMQELKSLENKKNCVVCFDANNKKEISEVISLSAIRINASSIIQEG